MLSAHLPGKRVIELFKYLECDGTAVCLYTALLNVSTPKQAMTNLNCITCAGCSQVTKVVCQVFTWLLERVLLILEK